MSPAIFVQFTFLFLIHHVPGHGLTLKSFYKPSKSWTQDPPAPATWVAWIIDTCHQIPLKIMLGVGFDKLRNCYQYITV